MLICKECLKEENHKSKLSKGFEEQEWEHTHTYIYTHTSPWDQNLTCVDGDGEWELEVLNWHHFPQLSWSSSSSSSFSWCFSFRSTPLYFIMDGRVSSNFKEKFKKAVERHGMDLRRRKKTKRNSIPLLSFPYLCSSLL